MTTELAKKTDSQKLVAQYETEAIEQIAQATAWANQVMALVEERKLYQNIGGKRYLEFEAWQTIARFDQATFETDWVKALVDGEAKITGYEARVKLIKGGNAIGAAIMSCGFDEPPCRGKDGMAKDKAAKSAAQTWAASKVARMNYSVVAVLAGFQPTPAEEMGGTPTPNSKQEPVCPIHKVPWKQHTKDDKSWWSHKDGDTWCNREAGETPQGRPMPSGTTESSTQEIPVGPPKTLPELWNWCLKFLKLNRTDALKKLGLSDEMQIASLGGAWVQLKELSTNAKT